MKSAIIGCGAICPTHVAAILAAGGQIVALCDTNAAAAEQIKARFGLKCQIYTDYKFMLNAEEVDCVHICTPHYLHSEMAIFALDKNINVLCEKPVCITAAQFRALAAAEKQSTAQLGVCFQNRYNNTTLAAKQALLGRKILYAKGVVNWHRAGEYYSLSPWRGTLSGEGGGVLINQALHTIDLAAYILGRPYSVIATCKNVAHPQNETEDTAFATYFGKNCFEISATTTASSDTPAWLEIQTTDGNTILLDCNAIYLNGKAETFDGEALGKQVWGDGHKKLVDDFYRCISENRHFAVDAAEGYGAVAMVLAAYRSRGKKTKINYR